MIAFGLDQLDPARLLLPRAVLYDLWNDVGGGDLRALSRRLRDFDVVHAPSLAVPPRSGAKLVVTVHDAAPILFPDTYTWRGRWFHQRGFAAAAKRADVVIAPTNVAADEVAGCTPIPRERIRVVPHGVVQREVGDGLVASTRKTLAVGDAPYVLWVGTLEPRKNVAVLVEGFRRMVERNADLPHRLVIVGPKGWLGTAESLREPARALGKRALFTGPVRADRLLALFRGAEPLRVAEPPRGIRAAGDRGDVAGDSGRLLRHPGAARGGRRRGPLRARPGPRSVGDRARRPAPRRGRPRPRLAPPVASMPRPSPGTAAPSAPAPSTARSSEG